MQDAFAGLRALQRPVRQVLDRATVAALAGSLLVINAYGDILLGSFRTLGLVGAVVALGGVSALVWFALFGLLSIAHEPGFDGLGARQLPIFALYVAAAFVPSPWVAALGVFALGAYLAVTNARSSRCGRIAVILLSLSGSLLWGKLLLAALSPLLLAIDSHVAAFFAGTVASGNLVPFAGGSGEFLVAPGCSSIHNISLALVLWGTVIPLLKLRVDARLVATCVAAMFAMFAINAARLVALATYPAHFEMLHYGIGATIFGWGSMIAAAAIVGLGAYDAALRQS